MAQTIYLQTQILEKDLTSYDDTIFDLKDRLTRVKEELKSESVDPKKNVSSMFKESSMAVRKRLEISSNVKVSGDLELFENFFIKLPVLGQKNCPGADRIRSRRFTDGLSYLLSPQTLTVPCNLLKFLIRRACWSTKRTSAPFSRRTRI